MARPAKTRPSHSGPASIRTRMRTNIRRSPPRKSRKIRSIGGSPPEDLPEATNQVRVEGETDVADWDFLFNVNVRTTLLCCRAVYPANAETESGQNHKRSKPRRFVWQRRLRGLQCF